MCVRALGVKTAAARRKVSMHMQVGRTLYRSAASPHARQLVLRSGEMDTGERE